MIHHYFYGVTETGIEYKMGYITFWFELDVCPECGKKLQPTNWMIYPHRHICVECYNTNTRYRDAVDREPNLRYDRRVKC